MFRKLEGRAPNITPPAGAIDCHIHIFDGDKYPAVEGGPPGPANALVSHYEKVQKWLGLERVVITQGNAHQKDNRCLLEALDHFKGKARGIVAIDGKISDAEIDDMSQKGVCGARIMDILKGAVGMDQLLQVNARVRPFNWSLIVQFDGREILDHQPTLEKIEGDYVIDHLGKFLEPVSVDSPQFKTLLRLVDKGNCFVKIAGCYETSKMGHPHYEDVGALAKALVKHAPERIIWGSNWPHNMATSAENYPDDVHLLDLAIEWMGSEENRQKIFIDNPSRLYNF